MLSGEDEGKRIDLHTKSYINNGWKGFYLITKAFRTRLFFYTKSYIKVETHCMCYSRLCD